MTSTADHMKDYILTHRLTTGGALPTETEFCDMLGVSRSSIREAFRTLATLDIVEVRHGRGAFVGTMSLAPLVETLVFRGVLNVGDDLRVLRDLVEVRQALDLSMAERIVDSLRGTVASEIDDLVAEMVERSRNGDTFPEQDRLFHTKLLAQIDNTLVSQLVAAFWDVHSLLLPTLGLAPPADTVQEAHSHGDMLRAGRAGDVEAFRVAVVRHYEPLHAALVAASMANAPTDRKDDQVSR